MFSLGKYMYFWAEESTYSLKQFPCELNLPYVAYAREPIRKNGGKENVLGAQIFSLPQTVI